MSRRRELRSTPYRTNLSNTTATTNRDHSPDIKVSDLYKNPVTAFLSNVASVTFWIFYWIAKVFIYVAAIGIIINFITPRYLIYLVNHATDHMLRFIKSHIEHSQIHGIAYLLHTKLHAVERCFWLALFIACTYYCAIIDLESLKRYQTQSTILGLERDFYNWHTTMPSVTVCPLKRLSVQLFEDYCRTHNIQNVTLQLVLYNFLESLANSTYRNFHNIINSTELDDLLDKLDIEPIKYMELIYNLTKDHAIRNEEQLIHFANVTVHGRLYDEIIETRQILTEHGLCYITNTYLQPEYLSHYFVHGKYDSRLNEGYDNKKQKFLQGKKFAYFDEDIQIYFLGFDNVPINAYIHSPFDTMQLDRHTGYTVTVKSHNVNSMDITCDSDLKTSTSVPQRQCRFPYENNLQYFSFYTKNLCLQECRLQLVADLCKCIPHFYAQNIHKSPWPVCHYKTLKYCLTLHTEYFLTFHSVKGEKYVCDCLPNCRDAIVSETKSIEQFADYYAGNSVIVSIEEPPRLRLKRQLVFSLTDYLVSIGATAGLFLGLNVLGIIEIFYNFTLRLICYMRHYTLD